MKYVEILEQLKSEGAQPLPVFMPFIDTNEAYEGNGYVTIPDTIPFNYLDKAYKVLDLKPIHSMTYKAMHGFEKMELLVNHALTCTHSQNR